MTINTVAVIAGLVFAWAVLSGVLARRNVTGPLVFAVAGYLLANPSWGSIHLDIDSSTIHVTAEITLALLLYSDAARVNLHELRRDVSVPVRLLGIGFPLSVIAGAIIAAALFDLPWGVAAFLGAALAPTDAALSLQVINDTRIPIRLRRSLNVESGLNDGIATPIVSVTLAVAASQLGVVNESVAIELGTALRALVVGIAIGAATGIGGALAINHAAHRNWIAPGGRRLSALALALIALTATLAADGNGFIAAFVAGAAFGAVANRDVIDLEHVNELPELVGEVLGLVVWFLFGAALLPVALDHASVRIVFYTVLSLTVVRMVPVGLSMLGAGLDRPTTLFLAWFGPRGLASIIFAILALEQLGDRPGAVDTAIATIATTVAASVLLHGITAGPGGRDYIRHEQPRDLDGPNPRHSSFRHVDSNRPI
jgi:NhaP-type Na+/H+ or K+/H+ antiporter